MEDWLSDSRRESSATQAAGWVSASARRWDSSCPGQASASCKIKFQEQCARLTGMSMACCLPQSSPSHSQSAPRVTSAALRTETSLSLSIASRKGHKLAICSWSAAAHPSTTTPSAAMPALRNPASGEVASAPSC